MNLVPSPTSIADQAEPRERMVQVVKWYLSAFHAGRKGSVAKKPYNPILGEVFYCHWDLPSEAESPTHVVRMFFTVSNGTGRMFRSPRVNPWQPLFFVQETVSEGPVPLCSANSVSFVAEQVSHHPPSKCLIILGCSVVEAFSLLCELTLNAAFLPEMCIFLCSVCSFCILRRVFK